MMSNSDARLVTSVLMAPALLGELLLVPVSLQAMAMANCFRPWRPLRNELWKIVLAAILPVAKSSRRGNFIAFLCHVLANHLSDQQTICWAGISRWRRNLKWLAPILLHLRSAYSLGVLQPVQVRMLALWTVLAIALPEVDGRRSRAAVQRWFLAARADPNEADDAAYTTENFSAWYMPPEGPHDRAYQPHSEREELYQHIIEMYYQGSPLVLLARQPQFYPFFLDLDLWGSDRSDDPLRSAMQEGDHLLLFQCIAEALFEIFPSHQILEVAAFHSSGIDRGKQRFKASFHVIFLNIIVERAELCNDDGPVPIGMCQTKKAASHILARDYVVGRLCEREGEDEKGKKLEALRKKVSSDSVASEGSVCPNQWSEILDENPFWHDPRAGRRSGLRLPFTDKRYEDEEPERRVKLPLGRWSVQKGGSLQPLPELSPMEWVSLGDISRPGHTPSQMFEDPLDVHEIDRICQCLVCRGVK